MAGIPSLLNLSGLASLVQYFPVSLCRGLNVIVQHVIQHQVARMPVTQGHPGGSLTSDVGITEACKFWSLYTSLSHGYGLSEAVTDAMVYVCGQRIL